MEIALIGATARAGFCGTCTDVWMMCSDAQVDRERIVSAGLAVENEARDSRICVSKMDIRLLAGSANWISGFWNQYGCGEYSWSQVSRHYEVNVSQRVGIGTYSGLPRFQLHMVYDAADYILHSILSVGLLSAHSDSWCQKLGHSHSDP